MPGVRQLAPTPPFGEEGLLVDALLPSETALNGDQLWVGLRGWHVLAPPPSRVLVHLTGDVAGSTGSEGEGEGETGRHRALAMARSLAGTIGASLTILATTERAEDSEALRAALEKWRAEHDLERAEVKVGAGDPLRQIAVEQQEHFYELLVLAASSGARSSGGQPQRVDRLAMRLLAQPPTPVLLTSGAVPQDAFKRILICTRAGEPGKSDVRVGGWLARRLGAAVTLLYVTREGEEPSALVRDHLGHAAATLRGLDVPADVRFRPAPSPVEGIVQEARSGAYAITVLGSHGPQSRSALARDDVTLQVATRAPTAVLVVPAEE
jgi:nucleotide-binding universal stress UspA family protein